MSPISLSNSVTFVIFFRTISRRNGLRDVIFIRKPNVRQQHLPPCETICPVPLRHDTTQRRYISGEVNSTEPWHTTLSVKSREHYVLAVQLCRHLRVIVIIPSNFQNYFLNSCPPIASTRLPIQFYLKKETSEQGTYCTIQSRGGSRYWKVTD